MSKLLFGPEAAMRVDVELDDDLADFVRANVDAGRFASAAEMMRVATNMLRGRANLEDWRWAVLGRSLEQADARPDEAVPADEFFDRRAARGRKAA